MAWTAQITGKELVNGSMVGVNVEFTNGSQSVSETLRSNSIESLKSIVRSRLDALNEAEVAVTQIPIGAFDASAPTPTTEEQEKQNFLTLYNRLQGVMRAVSLGLLAPDATIVTNLKASTQAAFKPAYIDLL